jgi:glycoside/pentoside/hexuronide:cation symporter, GPH family
MMLTRPNHDSKQNGLASSASALASDSAPSLPAPRLVGYSLVSLVLGMATIPLYVQVSRFYADNFGLSLALIGFVLLAARSVDAVTDPFAGVWSDNHCSKGGKRGFFLLVGIPLFSVGFLMLYAPQLFGLSKPGVVWFTVSLLVVYLGYSIAIVSYNAWGSEMSESPMQRTRAVAWRESFAAIGVLIAVVAPAVLEKQFGAVAGYQWFAMCVVALAVVMTLLTLAFSPPSVSQPSRSNRSVLGALLLPFRNPKFRPLIWIFLLNGTAAAIPAALIEFFVKDVVQAIDQLHVFFLAYFCAAIVGFPIWTSLARVMNQAKVWAISMAVAIGVFIWAVFIGAGDIYGYLAICVLSGLTLGADQAMPAVLLSRVIDADEANGNGRNEGAYFGLWSLLSKLNLGLAAGIALPLVQLLGYTSGGVNSQAALNALAIGYAVVPCIFKLIAFVLLWRSDFVRAPELHRS